MQDDLLADALNIADKIVRWRRRLHQRPELSGQEIQTADYLAEQLRHMGYEPKLRFGGGYGLVADLNAGDGPAVALRADMDALPVDERTGLECASQNSGVMHACGHDAHMAMLLGAAQLLRERRDQLKRPVRFIFQPHEELLPGGAPAMIDAGALNGVAELCALHVWADLPSGRLGTRVGPVTAAVDIFQITVHGKGGHAAMPDQCIDPIVIAAQIVSALQTVVSRSIPVVEPAVLTVGQFHAGTTDNVIPNQAVFGGTIRTFNEKVRERARARLSEIAERTAAAGDARAEIVLTRGYPVMINHPDAAQHLKNAAARVGFESDDIIEMAPSGVGEDCAYYNQKVPACFAFLGCSPADREPRPHHHPEFFVDESVLPRGAALLAQFALSPSPV